MSGTLAQQAFLLVQVVEHGSFRAAARALSIPKSTVSRKIAELEARLGARLLQRTSRRLSLTEIGEAYHARVAPAFAMLLEADRMVAEHESEPRGRLRVSAPAGFAARYLRPVACAFAARWPRVELELVTADRRVDLVAEGYDVAVRVGRLQDSSLVVRNLGLAERPFVASPRYLAAQGRPKRPEDLAEHRLVAQSGLDEAWAVQDGGRSRAIRIRPVLRFNDFDTILEAAVRGLGIASLPGFVVADAVRRRRLEIVLPAHAPRPVPIQIVYPSARHVSPKVRAFVDAVVDRLTPPPWQVS